MSHVAVVRRPRGKGLRSRRARERKHRLAEKSQAQRRIDRAGSYGAAATGLWQPAP